ncbi:MAG: DUF1467 family protein [Rhodospirillales bacterium]|nr:MAG: DUF1467 family protein [Rhodospirillales bacterium]
MSWATGILVFVVIWWTVVFAVLPIGVRRVDSATKGIERGAPERPELARKALITTAISAALWVVWYVLWARDVFGLRDGW